MSGIKETGELVVWLGKLASAIGGSMSDGTIDARDVWTLAGAIPGMPTAFSGITEVPKELKDLDSEEAGELIRLFSEAFEMPSSEAELKVETILQAIAQFYKMIREMQGK